MIIMDRYIITERGYIERSERVERTCIGGRHKEGSIHTECWFKRLARGIARYQAACQRNWNNLLGNVRLR